jgi:hypothetical protein
VVEQVNFETVWRAAGQTETTKGNIQNWFQLYERHPEFRLLKEEEIVAITL